VALGEEKMRMMCRAVMPLVLAVTFGIAPWGISAAWGGDRITDPTLPRRELKQLVPTKIYQKPSFYLTLGPIPTTGATESTTVLLRALRGGTYAPVRVLCKWEAIPTAGGAGQTMDNDAVCERKQFVLRAGTYRLRLSYRYLDENGVQMEGSSEAAGYVVAAAPRLVTQDLDYNAAKVAGAQFSNNVEGLTMARVEQCDWNGGGCSGGSIGHQMGVTFGVIYTTLGGGKGTPEAFSGFRLKNGWKVKSIEVKRAPDNSSGDWRWDRRPTEGTDDPSMRVHIWANQFGSQRIGVRVVIEGAEGTSPYVSRN
jgi:hypothetical protein